LQSDSKMEDAIMSEPIGQMLEETPNIYNTNIQSKYKNPENFKQSFN